MITLSVVVPFFNVQDFAADTLRSLANNARDDVEFLLVDDCSTDGTGELLERWAPRLPGARLVRHERNAGLAGARNTGIDAARGRWLTFLDGDDWLAPGYLAGLQAAAESLGCDFLRTDHVRVEGRRRTVVRAPEARRGRVLDPRASILPADRSTMVDYPYAWAGLYHRRLVDRGLLHFRPELRTAEDRPWIWRLHRRAESYAVLGTAGVYYRQGVATSLTQIGDVRQLAFLDAFRTVLAEVAEDPEAARLTPKAVRTFCAIISHHLGNLDRFEAPVARQLKERAARALREMPQEALAAALEGMDEQRARGLRRLRRRGAAGGSDAGSDAGSGSGAGSGAAAEGMAADEVASGAAVGSGGVPGEAA